MQRNNYNKLQHLHYLWVQPVRQQHCSLLLLCQWEGKMPVDRVLRSKYSIRLLIRWLKPQLVVFRFIFLQMHRIIEVLL
jgi:hypothetical protein